MRPFGSFYGGDDAGTLVVVSPSHHSPPRFAHGLNFPWCPLSVLYANKSTKVVTYNPEVGRTPHGTLRLTGLILITGVAVPRGTSPVIKRSKET